MREINGNLFDYMLPKCGVCVTTNGIVKQNAKAVMGAGIAKLFASKFPGVDYTLGEKIMLNGNHAYVIGSYNDCNILSFPTKNDWRDKSDLNLIIRSAKELVDIKNDLNLKEVYFPVPGCGLGRLNEKDVVTKLETIFDDTFIMVRFI